MQYGIMLAPRQPSHRPQPLSIAASGDIDQEGRLKARGAVPPFWYVSRH
jgi:hypothetical protein